MVDFYQWPAWLGAAAGSAITAGVLLWLGTRPAAHTALRWWAAAARTVPSDGTPTTGEPRLRDFAEASSDWFWEMGPDLRFTYMSDRLRDALGIDPPYMLGKRRDEVSDLTIEPEKWRHHLTDLAAHRPFRDFTYKIVLPDRRTRHISVSGKPLFDATGAFLGYRGSGRDVTAAVKRDQALRRQTAFLMALVENLPIGISVVDPKLDVIAFNQSFLDLLDFPRDHFRIGDPFEKFIRFNAERGEYGPGDLDALVRERVALAAKPAAHQFERRRPDGRIVDIRGIPLPEGGFVTIYIDVTERRNAEEQLKNSERRFRDFAESSSDWLWEQDAELRFSYMSPNALDRYGFKADDFIGRTRWETAPLGVSEEQWRAHIGDLEARRPFREFKFCRLDSNGQECWVTLSGRPVFNAEGEFVGYRGTGRDITAEVEAERRANLAQRRLSTAVESLSDGLAFFDANDRLVTCNDAYRRLMAPIEHLVVPGVAFKELLHAGMAAGRYPDVEDKDAFIRRRLEQHRNPRGVVQRQLMNGNWVQIREQRLADGGIALISTDITELKQKETELAQKTAALEATLANMSEGISVYDGALRLVAFNAHWKEMLQFPDEVARVGTPFRAVLEYMAARGDFGTEDGATAVAKRLAQVHEGKLHRFAKWWPSGRFVEIRRTPMPDGGFISVMADLTDLKNTEERFKDFAEASSDWFWEQDAELRFSYMSPGVYEKSGITPEAHIGKTRTETKPLGVSDEQWLAHKADLEARRAFRDFRLQRTDPHGRLRTLAISGKPVFDGEGRFLGYRGTGSDITERIEAEARAHLTQVRFASAIESLEDAIAIFDANDRLVMCNRAYRGAVGPIGDGLQPGIAFEEILRSNVYNGIIGPLEDKEAFIATRLAQHRQPGKAIQIANSDGTWLQVREQRLSDGGIAVIGTDITATKLREQELFEKSDILQRTLANMGEGIIVFDRELRLIAWNARMIELLDLPRDFCHVGLPYEDYLRLQAARGEYGTDDIEEAVRVRALRASEPQPLQLGRWRPNGRFIELRRNPMPGGGFVSLYSDATERKRAEDALRDAKETAEIANRTKSEFLANMSHELRTPLNAIIGFSEIIQQELFGPIGSTRYKEYATDIYDSGTHLLKLINDILDVSKAEAGKVDLQESRLDIADVIDASVRLVGSRAREAGIHLALPRTDHLPQVLADERRLKQVLLNLLSNAVKFTPAGGRVVLEVSNDPSSGFTVKVIDTGIGMAREDIPKALEPFGQVDSKLARKYEGTGLGLPLSKALVELHGGRLEVESEVGTGTTVTVTLPPSRVMQRDLSAVVHHLKRKSR